MDEEKEYDIDDEQEEDSDGYYDMSDDYDENELNEDYDQDELDDLSDYSYPSSQPNRFINNFKDSKKDDSDDKIEKELEKENKNLEEKFNKASINNNSNNSNSSNNQNNRINQPNNQGNSQNDSLKKNIDKQAVEKPKESNIAKGNSNSNGTSGADIAKKMAADKAKNTMNSIHDNNVNQNSSTEGPQENSSGDNSNEKSAMASKISQAKQAGEEAGKEALSKAITAETGIPKPIADKIAEMSINKKKKEMKVKMYIFIGILAFVFFLIVGLVYNGDSSEASDKSSNLSKFYSGEMSDEDLYYYFVNSGIVDPDLCVNSNDEFDNSCEFMKFLDKIKSKTDSERQFLYIFFAITYGREYDKFIDQDDELDALIENRKELSTYLNDGYLKTYRMDIDSDYDLYGYITKIIGEDTSSNASNYSACDFIEVIGEDSPVPFEEYVAGVVKHEMGHATSEATKALAIAARTYAYNATNGCTVPISNSTNQQMFSKIDLSIENDKRISDLVNEVAGIILEDANGKVFSTQYDSFCFTSKDDEKQIYHFHQGNVDIPFSWTVEKRILQNGTVDYKMKDGQTHTSGWIRLNCPCNTSYNQVADDPRYAPSCTTLEGEYRDGGHGNGMSQYGAWYLDEVEKLKYDEILRRFYGNDIIFATLSVEFSTDSVTGFNVREHRAQRNNPYIYRTDDGSLEGECPWYANGRAHEILASWGKKYVGIGGNGGQFCANAPAAGYTKINWRNIDSIEPASYISWQYGEYGHIAIVESVKRDDSGKVVEIKISEGAINFYNTGNNITKSINEPFIFNNNIIKFDSNYSARSFVNDTSLGGTNAERRKALCEMYGTGCQQTRTMSRQDIYNYGGSNGSFCTIPLSQVTN